MHIVKRYPYGFFCWVDLATSDAADAKKFYTSLFGWDAVDVPVTMGGSQMTYTLLRIGGHNVAGLFQMPGGEAQSPSAWTSYVNVEDIDAVVGKAAELGASVVIPPPADAREMGRAALIRDTGGAYLGLWQANSVIGAEVVSVPRALTWNELSTRDVARARRFYADLFGWSMNVMPSPAGDGRGYTAIMIGERMNGGMFEVDESWQDTPSAPIHPSVLAQFKGDEKRGGVPSHWMVYFGVESRQETVARCEALGGKTIMRLDIPGEGKMATLADRQRAIFTVLEAPAYDPIPEGWR